MGLYDTFPGMKSDVSNENKSGGGKKTPVWLILIIILVIIMCMGGGLYLYSSFKKNTKI